MKPIIYAATSHARSSHLALAMQIGFRKHGLVVPIVTRWTGRPEGDVALAYGWAHETTFKAYKAAGGHFAYFDLGYWNRHPSKSKGGHREGSYRLALDSWDTADRMATGCPDDRWKASGLTLSPPVRSELNDHQKIVLVPGMSPKAAGTHGFNPGQWEALMVAHLATLTHLTVQLREKAKRLNGMEPIEDVLRRTWLVVTHHSNVAVDALIAGVPVHATKGVGRLWSGELTAGGTLARTLYVPDNRVQLLSDVAYAQWTPDEMRSGAAWDHIKGVLS